jgi:hypothetical protein
MLIVALVLAAVQLWLVNQATVRRSDRVPLIVVALVLGFAFGGMMFPPVALQTLLLSLALVAWRAFKLGPGRFALLSITAFATAFGAATWFALDYRQRVERWRDRFPFESVAERLPEPKPWLRPRAMPPATDQRLLRVEGRINERYDLRSSDLTRLHSMAVELFVNSPGFGSGRMTWPSERGLTDGLRDGPPVPQPGGRLLPPSPDSASASDRRPHDESELSALHEKGIVDFAYPAGFGYVRDRNRVAGFEPHQFGRVPESKVWSVQTIDLVGLLLHKKPVVYLSDHLPRMDELRGAATRPLDAFESEGLESLRRGEDLVVRPAADGLRLLGAVRSARQCVDCHGGERGDLLGAFSYSLR